MRTCFPASGCRLHAAYGAALTRDPALAGEAAAAVSSALAYHWYEALDLPRALPAVIDAAEPRDRHATHRRRRCANWSGPWRSGRGCPTREQRTGLDAGRGGRLAGRGRLTAGDLDRSKSLLDRRSPGCRPRATPSGGRCCSSVTRTRCGTERPRGRSVTPWSRRSPCCPPTGRARAHAVVLSSLAARCGAHRTWPPRGRQVAARAVPVARAAGAAQEEADVDHHARLGACATCEPASRPASRRCARGGAGPGARHARLAAVRGYVNLSDVLELLGPARRGGRGGRGRARAGGAGRAVARPSAPS